MAKRFKNKIIIPDDPPKGPPLYIDILLLFIAPPFSSMVWKSMPTTSCGLSPPVMTRQ